MALLSSLVFGLAACGPDYPKCDDDKDCHKGEFCVNKMCQKCRDSGDCGPGQECSGGRCDDIEGYCAGDGDCAHGQECSDGRCIDKLEPPDPEPEPPPPPEEPRCSVQSVYFDYDSSELTAGTRDRLSSNARCLGTRGYRNVHLTGFTDPRGTEEYNLALGDRRARSARQYLQSFGVDAHITTSSMGEEMARGMDESSWAEDRRVDFDAR